MAFKIQGFSGTQNEVEANTRALRVIPKPLDIGAFGSYRAEAVTGTMAAGIGAASEILQFRWTDATRAAYVRQVIVSMTSLGTGFTAGVGLFEMLVARSFTVAGTGGGTLTLAALQKMATSFGSSLVGEIRIATTAALGAGTKTLDTYAIASLGWVIPVTVSYQCLPTASLFTPDLGASEHPLILKTNEGFVVRCTMPATGTWAARLIVSWSELLEY